MLHVVLFTDNPDRAEARQRLMPAHLAFLERHQDRIRAAGPLLEAAGEGAGGLWLVEAESSQAVMDLVRANPFWPTGLRQGVRVLRWVQVFAAADACAEAERPTPGCRLPCRSHRQSLRACRL